MSRRRQMDSRETQKQCEEKSAQLLIIPSVGLEYRLRSSNRAMSTLICAARCCLRRAAQSVPDVCANWHDHWPEQHCVEMYHKWYFIECPVMPYQAPRKVKMHRSPPWEQPPLWFGSRYPGLLAGLSHFERETSDPLSGSACFATDHIHSSVICGLVDNMISNFCELHGWRGNPVRSFWCSPCPTCPSGANYGLSCVATELTVATWLGQTAKPPCRVCATSSAPPQGIQPISQPANSIWAPRGWRGDCIMGGGEHG